MKLDEHVAALRELGEPGNEPDDGSSTRLRVRRTLERGHATRRHAGWLAAMGVLLVASAAWGFASGILTHADPPPPAMAPVAVTAPVAVPVAVAAPVAAVPVPAPSPLPSPSPSPPPPPSPAPVAAAPSRLYANAHALYFHDANYAAALSAFDDYLAHEPTGAFVTEARYNRALCLVRLGQLADAKLALQPFADGAVLAGYRQAEAATLIDKIDRRLNGTP